MERAYSEELERLGVKTTSSEDRSKYLKLTSAQCFDTSNSRGILNDGLCFSMLVSY
jgi:hypothetical protein